MDAASKKAKDQIRAAIDAGEYKEAARLASQHLIRKQHGGGRHTELAPLFKALRTVALTRCGQEDDAVSAARELERIEDKSFEATRLVNVAFKELREVYYLPPTRTGARQFLPLSEAEDTCTFLDGLASNSLRFDKLQQGAWKLYSKFKRPKYLEWVLVCILLQGIGPTSEATWSLAQMLLAKLPPVEDLPQLVQSPPDIMRTPAGCCKRRDAYARFILRLSVLRQSSQYADALDLLDRQKGMSLVPLEELSLRLQILLEAGRLREAFGVSKQLLESGPLNIKNYENCIALALACEDAGEDSALLKDLEAQWTAASDTSFEAAHAVLALHRLAVVRPLSKACHQVWTDACLEKMWPDAAREEIVKHVVKFVRAHGHDPRTFFTVRGLLGCLERLEAAQTAASVAEKRDETDAAWARGNQRAELHAAFKNLVCLEKTLHAVGHYTACSSRAVSAVNYWVRVCFDYQKVAGRDKSAADELLLLAVDLLLFLDFESCRNEASPLLPPSQGTPTDPLLRRRFYFIALTLLSQAISGDAASRAGFCPAASSPGHRAVLQWLSASVGLLTKSKELFGSLDIKNAMLASLGYSLLFPLSDYGLSADVVKIVKQIQNLSEDTTNSTADGLCACLEEGSYTAIADCVLGRNAVCSSLLASLAGLEGCIHQSCDESMDFQRAVLSIACTTKLQQISFPLLSAARISARDAVLPGFSLDLTGLALAGEDRMAGRVAATVLDCKSVVCNLTASPPESARLLLHLADPVQRSLSVYAALKEGEQGTQRRTRTEVVVAVEEEIQRAAAGTQELVKGWTPVAPGRLVSAESMHALTASLPQAFSTLLQHQEQKTQHNSLQKGSGLDEEEEDARELLDALYGKSWRCPTEGGNASSGGLSAGPVSPSKTAELISKLVGGAGKRARLRCLTLHALLPPVAPYLHGAPLAYTCLEAELQLSLGQGGGAANGSDSVVDRGSAPAREAKIDRRSHGASDIPVCWPSAAVGGPSECNVGGALPWQSGRLAVQWTVELLLRGTKLLETGFALRTGNHAKPAMPECCDRLEELFQEGLASFVQGCRDIMHLAAQSICEGFAAFLPARRSTLLEYAESFKARRPLPGAADTSVALTLWDALYVLATLSTTHFAVLTAALQYGAVMKKPPPEHAAKEKIVLTKTPFQTRASETVGRLIHDTHGVIATAAEIGSIVEELKQGGQPTRASAWWVEPPECGPKDDEYRLDFVDSQEFAQVAATLAADSVISYGRDVLPAIAQGLQRRKVWLEQVSTFTPMVAGFSLPNVGPGRPEASM